MGVVFRTDDRFCAASNDFGAGRPESIRILIRSQRFNVVCIAAHHRKLRFHSVVSDIIDALIISDTCDVSVVNITAKGDAFEDVI